MVFVDRLQTESRDYSIIHSHATKQLRSQGWHIQGVIHPLILVRPHKVKNDLFMKVETSRVDRSVNHLHAAKRLRCHEKIQTIATFSSVHSA